MSNIKYSSYLCLLLLCFSRSPRSLFLFLELKSSLLKLLSSSAASRSKSDQSLPDSSSLPSSMRPKLYLLIQVSHADHLTALTLITVTAILRCLRILGIVIRLILAFQIGRLVRIVLF